MNKLVHISRVFQYELKYILIIDFISTSLNNVKAVFIDVLHIIFISIKKHWLYTSFILIDTIKAHVIKNL